MDGTARDVTNRYLDELFGKSDKNSAPKSETATSSASGESQMSLDEIEDVYHTRPVLPSGRVPLGAGGAKIIDYHIQSAGVDFPPSLTGNQQTDFLMKVVFEYDFDCVVPGLLIKTLDGLFLYGTNSFRPRKAGKTFRYHVGTLEYLNSVFRLI